MTHHSHSRETPATVRPPAEFSRREPRWNRICRWANRLVQHRRTADLFGIDVRGLALFRVGLALLLLADLAGRARFLTAHYTDAGPVTRSLMVGRMQPWTVSLHWMNGSLLFAALLFLAAAVFALLLLVGYRTRLATVVSWVLLVSLHYRNPLVSTAGDHVLRVLMFWAMFLPLGICGSVDRRLRGDAAGGQQPQSVLSMATLGLLLQVAFIYVFSAMLKTSPVWRHDGSALYYALSLDYLTTPVGRRLLNFPELCRWMSFATLGLEAAVPVMAFLPLATRCFRTAAVLLFVGFHAGLALTMHLILFPFVCMIAWLVFLPPSFWDRLAATRAGVAIAGGWPRFIDCAAGTVKLCHRRLASRQAAAPRHDDVPYRPWRTTNALAALALVYVLGWNLHSVTKRTDYALPKLGKAIGMNETMRDAVAGVGSMLGVAQGWIMFSPYPPREDGWWVVEATLADGSRVDLYRGGRPVSWERPASIAGEYTSHRWRKYMMSLWESNRRYHARHYARWLRREWDKTHAAEQRVESLRLWFMLEYTRPPGQPPLSAKLPVYRWSTSGEDDLTSYSTNRREYRRLLGEADML